MKKILLFSFIVFVGITNYSWSRDNATTRSANRNTETENVSSARSATRSTARTNSSNQTRTQTKNVNVRSTASSNNNTTKAVKGRSATTKTNKTVNARSATTTSKNRTKTNTNASSARAATAIATQKVNKKSSFSSSYDACKESYIACMDEFCSTPDASLRRCYCSSRVSEFQTIAKNIDESKNKLVEFNNNLEKINLTAEEAEYVAKATEGELAVTSTDNSTTKQLLADIDNLINGKKSSSNDLFAGFNTTTIFDTDYLFSNDFDTVINETKGTELLNSTYAMCKQIIADTCNENDLKLAVKYYENLISSDCLAVEKNYNQQKLQLKQTVSNANKLLTETRLNDYNKRNSADFVTCLSNVKTAFSDEAACGENMIKCIDYTGKYINSTTGEIIFSEDFAPKKENGDETEIGGIMALITTPNEDDNKTDISKLSANKKFNKYLDGKKKYAERALKQCERIADDVWLEFKNQFMIQAKQIHQEKYAELKNTCVKAVSECYVTQEKSLNAFDSDVQVLFNQNTKNAIETICKETTQMCNNLYGFSDNSSLEAIINDIVNTKVVSGCGEKFANCLQNSCGGSDYSNCVYSSRKNILSACISNTKSYCPATTAITADNLINGLHTTNSLAYTSDKEEDKLVYQAFLDAYKNMENTLLTKLRSDCASIDGSFEVNEERDEPNINDAKTKNLTAWSYNSSWGYCKADTSLCKSKLAACIEETSVCSNIDSWVNKNGSFENSQCKSICSFNAMNGYCDNEESYNNYYASLTSEYITMAFDKMEAELALAKDDCKNSATMILEEDKHETFITTYWTGQSCRKCTINAQCDGVVLADACKKYRYRSTVGNYASGDGWRYDRGGDCGWLLDACVRNSTARASFYTEQPVCKD